MESYIVYAMINSNGYVTGVNSSEFLKDTAGWEKIDEGTGDRYHHAQNHYFDKPITTDGGAYRYKRVDGRITACSENEVLEQEGANVPDSDTNPSLEDRVGDLESALEMILTGVTE